MEQLCRPQLRGAALQYFVSKIYRELYASSHSPWLGTPAIRAAFVEVVWLLEKKFSIMVLLTLDRETIIDVILGLHQLEEGIPSIRSFLALHVGFHVAKHDEAISCSGEKDVKPLTRCEEADFAIWVAPGQGDNDYVGLLTLIVIFDGQS